MVGHNLHWQQEYYFCIIKHGGWPYKHGEKGAGGKLVCSSGWVTRGGWPAKGWGGQVLTPLAAWFHPWGLLAAQLPCRPQRSLCVWRGAPHAAGMAAS